MRRLSLPFTLHTFMIAIRKKDMRFIIIDIRIYWMKKLVNKEIEVITSIE